MPALSAAPELQHENFFLRFAPVFRGANKN